MEWNFLQKYLNLKDVPCLLLPEMFKEACKYIKIDGLLIEVGVFQGQSAKDILNAYIEVTQFPDRFDKILYGFDSFLGLEEDLTPMNHKGTTQLPDFVKYVSRFPLNLYLIKGRVEDTLIPFLEKHLENISFINIDMTYISTKYVLKILAKHNRLIKGSIVCIEQAIRPENGKIYDGNYKAFIEIMNEFNIKYKYIACADCHFATMIE